MQQEANPPGSAGNQDDLGIIKDVDVRQVWRYEAHNFTPWLARNLRRLGQALHLDLEPAGITEFSVGRYSLDILAQEAGPDGRNVAIENQLEWSDHNHLGQLLTYASGREVQVQVAIWIAAEFRDEHKDAIRWLNRLAPDKVEFYGVKVRAIRIDDSKPAPIFEPVVVPDDWPRQNRKPAPQISGEERHLYHRFHQSLREDLANRGITENNTGIPGCYIYREFKPGEAWVHLWLGHRKAADINHIFDALKSEQAEIEQEFAAGEWLWDRRGDNQRYAHVWLSKPDPAAINDPPEKLAETQAWLADTVIKFKETFNPRIEKILAEMAAAEPGE